MILRKGPKNEECIMEVIRNEVERCDMLGGFLVASSAAGGTGSGVGTYITETLKNHYPLSDILNHTILPFSSGEVSVQSYNTILTLSKLNDFSDGIIVVNNQDLDNICRNTIRCQGSLFCVMYACKQKRLLSL